MRFLIGVVCVIAFFGAVYAQDRCEACEGVAKALKKHGEFNKRSRRVADGFFSRVRVPESLKVRIWEAKMNNFLDGLLHHDADREQYRDISSELSESSEDSFRIATTTTTTTTTATTTSSTTKSTRAPVPSFGFAVEFADGSVEVADGADKVADGVVEVADGEDKVSDGAVEVADSTAGIAGIFFYWLSKIFDIFRHPVLVCRRKRDLASTERNMAGIYGEEEDNPFEYMDPTHIPPSDLPEEMDAFIKQAVSSLKCELCKLGISIDSSNVTLLQTGRDGAPMRKLLCRSLTEKGDQRKCKTVLRQASEIFLQILGSIFGSLETCEGLKSCQVE